MSDTIEILRKKVVQSFNEYKDYIELVNKQNEDKKEKVDTIKEVYEKNEDDDEVMDFAFQIFMVDALHKRDIDILASKFANYMSLFKEIPDVKPLNEEIEVAYETVKKGSKVQAFSVVKGKFEEINKDTIEEQRKIFENKEVLHTVKEQLKKIF